MLLVREWLVGRNFRTQSYTGGTTTPLSFNYTGYVGIGTNSPQTQLHVFGKATINTNNTQSLFVSNIDSSTL